MKQLTLKRLLSAALVLAMLIACMPSILLWEAKAVEEESETVTETQNNRETIYFSTSGSDFYSGKSESRPKKDITKIGTYLAQGYNVKLKRGDVWYLPTNSISLKDLHGTEENPLVIGSYGDSNAPKPVIAYMHDFTAMTWTLVDAEKNVYSLNISSLAERNSMRIHRAFVEGESYFHRSITDYNLLEEKEFCDYDGVLYMRTTGGAPTNVEATPYGWGALRLNIENVSYLTMENLHIKGGNAINPLIKLNAPTTNFRLTHCDVTHTFYYIFQMESESADVNYQPEISYCYFDTMYSEKEGFVNSENGDNNDINHWNTTLTEGITMRDGVDGAWIHHNTIRQMGHAFIAIENLDRHQETKADGSTGQGYLVTGVHNCIIEDNLLEGGNSCYARAFNICGGFNLNGDNLCTNNVYRRNQVYDMTTSSHLNGHYNLIYSNVFSYTHCVYTEDGTLFEGKGPQPWAFDTILWSDYTSVGNIVVNNTFYDMAGAWAIYNQNSKVYSNLFANNLVVNYTDDHGDYMGGFHDRTNSYNMAMNNGFFSGNKQDHIVIDGVHYTAEEANSVSGFSGNISGNPIFLTADLSIINQRYARQDFSLSSASPYIAAGLPLNDKVYRQYGNWKNIVSILKADYTDLNGNPYDPDAPTIGAITYTTSASDVSIESASAKTPPLAITANFKELVGSNWEQVLGLATSARVTLSDGRVGNVAVKWDYSAITNWNTVGQYQLTGTLSSVDFANPKGLTLSQTILILPYENLLYNPSFELNGGSLTGWAGSGNAKNTNAAHASDGTTSILKTVKSGITDSSYNILYQANHGSDPATSTNYASLLAQAVNAKGAGTYYISVDAKAATSSAAEYSFYVRLTSKNVYSDSNYASLCSSPTTKLPASSEAFATSALIFDLSGEFNWLRTNVYLSGEGSTMAGQKVYIDNLKLICLRQELDICEHIWNDATCIFPKTCANCGATEGAALGHTPGAAVRENETAATCAASGTYDSVVYCSVCQASLKKETVTTPATGKHDYISGICSICGDKEVPNMLKITTKTPTLAIITGFKDYVGEDWQSALALVSEVTVELSDGSTAKVPVAWDYSPLGDLTTVGKYVLTGTPVSSEYANLNGLTITQTIHIRNHSNLFYNPSFEEGSKGNTGWGGSGTTAKNTDSAHITHGSSSLLKVTPTITGTRTTYQLGFQTSHDVDPATGTNYAVLLANAVKAQGKGLYYISFDAKGSAEAMANAYTVYINLLTKEVYNGTSTTLGTTTPVALNPVGGSFATSSGLYELSGEDNWMRTDIYLKGNSGTLTGVGVYLDNAQFLLVRQELAECVHNWINATCIAPKTCMLCGETEGETIGHSHGAQTDCTVAVNCSVCGEMIYAAKEHTWADEQDTTCDVCGATREVGPAKDENLKFVQAPSLSFQDYIGMQVMIYSSLAKNYDEIYVEAVQMDPEKGAVTTKLTGILYYFDMFYVFDQQILSWSMAEEVTLTLYGVKNGETFVGQTYTYSVETLALAMLNAYKDSNAKLCKVLVDMLNYGAAVQTTYNHNAALLPNTQLSAYAHLGTAGDPALNATVSKEGTGPVAIAQVSISMQSKVEIQLLFAQNISTYTAKAMNGETALNCVIDTETMAAYGYTIVRVAIGASNMRDNIVLGLYDAEGNAVTTVYTVSAEAFAKSLANGAQGAVALAMMRYGDAVAAYAN